MDKREKVISILKKNGLESYIPLFEKNKLMDKKVLSQMKERDYEKVGVDSVADQKRLVAIFGANMKMGCLIAFLIFVAVAVLGIVILHQVGVLESVVQGLKWLGISCVAILVICFLGALGLM